MEYKKRVMGGYNLHLIKTDKFKICHVEVIFRNNVDVNEITKRQFLTKMLCENNEDYPSRRKLLLKFEDLYNVSIYGQTSKVGESIITNICADFLNPEYTEKGMVKESIKLLFEMIFKPNVKNKEFDIKSFELIKERLKDSIKSAYDSPQRYAVLNALKSLCNTPTSYSNLGSLSDLEDITPENLYECYEKMLKNDYVDIFVVGNLDMDEIADYIDEYAHFKVIKNHPINMYVVNPKIKEKYVADKFDSVQSHIVMILNFNNLTDYEKKYVVNLYNMILGGGSLQTKLYKKLRSENSLCYGVSSYYQKYDGIIIINTSVDIGNSDTAVKLIRAALKDMTNNISNEEINDAKELLVSSLNSIKDDVDRITNNYYYQDLGEIDDIETRIKSFKNVTKEEIYALSKKISISLVYNLEGGNDE